MRQLQQVKQQNQPREQQEPATEMLAQLAVQQPSNSEGMPEVQ